MLPPAHIAYTWLGLTVVQEKLGQFKDVDYRLMALAATGSDLIDKPLAWLYFYKRYRSAVLFAHTGISYLAVAILGFLRFRSLAPYILGYLGHALCDRLWHFPDTFYWPFRGWRFHVWGKQGGKQKDIGTAYWVTFTRRPELWVWELGGLLSFTLFIWWHKLYEPKKLMRFIRTGRPSTQPVPWAGSANDETSK